MATGGLVALGLAALLFSSSWALSRAEPKRLSGDISVQSLDGGPSEAFHFDMERPGKLRREGKALTVVSDGVSITTYKTGDSTFMKQPFSSGALRALLSRKELRAWSTFLLNQAPLLVGLQPGGKRTLRGVESHTFSLNDGELTGTLLINAKTALAQGVQRSGPEGKHLI